jgi:hypothetical protein
MVSEKKIQPPQTVLKKKKKDSFWTQPGMQEKIAEYTKILESKGIPQSKPSDHREKIENDPKYEFYKGWTEEQLLARKKEIMERLRLVPYEKFKRKWWYFSDRQFLKFSKYVIGFYCIYRIYMWFKGFFL